MGIFELITKLKFLLRYLLELSYNGTNYHGWQIQPNSSSVQETIEKCLSLILKEKIDLIGAGRTDTGVHASYFCAHFDSKSKINDQKDFIHKLNSFLPNDISIQSVASVTKNFHSRFDAISRTYIYKINLNKNPFLQKKSYYFKNKNLNFSKMNLAAMKLYDYMDFKCFSKSNSDVKTHDCKITSAKWSNQLDHWTFEISSDRFLRNMVRAIVGTLIEIGIEKYKIDYLDDILKSRDREKAGYSVPAHGLYLKNIVYPKNIFIDE